MNGRQSKKLRQLVRRQEAEAIKKANTLMWDEFKQGMRPKPRWMPQFVWKFILTKLVFKV